MPAAARGDKIPCSISSRLAMLDLWLNDDNMERITDVVRVHISVHHMVALLNMEGWAGVIATIPRRAKKQLAALAGELETEVSSAAARLQRWFRHFQVRRAEVKDSLMLPGKRKCASFFIGDAVTLEVIYDRNWAKHFLGDGAYDSRTHASGNRASKILSLLT